MVSFNAMLRERAYQDSKRTFTELPELDGIWLNMVSAEGELHPLVEGVAFYTPDGEPIPGVGIDATWKMIEYKRAAPHYVSEVFYRSGHSIQVSTVYLGSHQGGPGTSHPIVWETAVFIDNRPDVVGRYFLPAAARDGHREVVRLIRQEQRRRRMLWREKRIIPQLIPSGWDH